MPNIPTFASAAAGNSQDSQSRATSSRGDSSAPDWGQRRPNGATQTFRRTSSTRDVANAAHSRDTSAAVTSTTSAYVPPHIHQARNGIISGTQYSKQSLLGLFKDQRDAGDLDSPPTELQIRDRDASHTNGSAFDNKWARRDDPHPSDPASGVEICLIEDPAGFIPTGLVEPTDEEREIFASVNSTIKPANQTGAPREGQAARKISLSTGSQAINSPSSTRPSNRRRETGESLMSPKIGRDENTPSSPPPALVRRRTDLREGAAPLEERARETGGSTPIGASAPIGSLKRSSTQPFASAVNTPASPWATGSSNATMGSFGNFQIPNDRRPGAGPRGESRFKGLMSRESAEDIGDRQAMTGLGRVAEAQDHGADSREHLGQGSAALGGDSPPHGSSYPEITPQRQRVGLGQGLAGLGDTTGFPGQGQYPPGNQQQSQQESPTYTNPYTSPEHARQHEQDPDNSGEGNQFHFPGLGGLRQEVSGNPAAFNARMASAFGDPHAFDRSSNSAMGNRGFSGLGGLGGLGAFGADPSLRSPATMQSPSLAGLGGSSAFSQAPSNASQTGSIGRSSRLGSLFPTAMQDQMRAGRGFDAQSEDTDEHSSSFGNTGFGQGMHPARDTESPLRTIRGKFDDFFSAGDKGLDQSQELYGGAQLGGGVGAVGTPGQQPPGPQRVPSNIGGGGSSGQPPAPQQKTMVMPDRIRWIYRDPQGNTQGPWSGLEMHDWYRAGFFSPELLVKKVEDADYEPLAQLIRRIGNSREPFLVPQIGIPGPPSSQSGSWPNQPTAPPTAGAGPPASANAPGAQPPFAGSFPSFGTTLTAEQQNALERRKQEEQYLMARQKEHLAQQQLMVKQMQMQGQYGLPNQALQHHSSANSLHSQPSYGSITSPTGYQPSPMIGPGPLSQGFHGHGDHHNQFRGGIGPIGSGIDSLGDIKEEDLPDIMSRLGVNESQLAGLAGRSGQDRFGAISQPASAAFAERARLQQEAAEHENRERQAHDEAHSDGRRLQQFQHLQQHGHGEAELKHEDELSHEPHEDDDYDHMPDAQPESFEPATAVPRDLTLTEQVQKAASAKQSPAHGASGWQKVDSDVPDASALPPQSSSPLPAPAARRKHGNMADQLNVESVVQSASPSVETPTTSLAPWAKEPIETQKQPSLKEIQEAEARRAAKQEELNQQARRAALERELAATQAAAVAAASGLPSSSTWASGSAEPSPSTTNAPWAKMTGGKSTPISGAKKTLQQIQKEEEARKQRQMAAAAAANPPPVTINAPAVGVKRYTDLLGKSASPVSAAMAAAATNAGGTGAWTTVGAGGKPKPPPAPTGPSIQRTASGTLGRTVSSSSMVAKPPAPVRANTSTNSTADALQSLQRWAMAELRPDLTKKGISPEDFVDTLLNLGTDTDIITEAVHINSQTIDSRHFAEEFVRRRVLADKGKMVEAAGPVSSSSGAAGSAGGWSEVARKGPSKASPAQDESIGAFKVVAGKKKAAKK